MIDLLLMALFQTAAGDPGAPGAETTLSQTQAAASATSGAAPPAVSGVEVPSPPADAQGIQCVRVRVTGTRAKRELICTTAEARRIARETAQSIANSGGRAGSQAAMGGR